MGDQRRKTVDHERRNSRRHLPFRANGTGDHRICRRNKTSRIQLGSPEKKMGIRGSHTSAITFDNVRIPKENIIGDDGRGFLVAMKTLDAGRLGLGAACLGACKELLVLSTKYAKERKQFDEPIAIFRPFSSCSRISPLRFTRWNR